MKVKLIKWQDEVAKDNHRFRIVCAGRRAGKSVLSRMIILRWACQKTGLYWIVSPTYKQAKMIHWRDMQKEIPRQWIEKKNEVELSFTLQNGSIIELKGADNPDSLRGIGLRGLVIDEIASIRNWGWLWAEVLRPTLTDYESPAIFISTPKGYNHFYELYNLGQKKEGLYKSWRFTSYDNPILPKGEIDEAEKTLTEDTFAQEYLADFRKFTGLVYKGFEREVHVIEPFDIPDEWSIYCGYDFGSTNPTVALQIAVDNDDNWFIVYEHYESGKTIDYHAGQINSTPLTKKVIQGFGDPSGAQWIKEFSERGIYITPANKETSTSIHNWVRFGIEKVAEKLKVLPGRFVSSARMPMGGRNGGGSGNGVRVKGMPSLFIFSSCTNTIKEFENYRWKEKSVTQAQDLNEPDVPEKANDHAMDALRYFAVSYKKTDTGKAPPNPFDGIRIGADRRELPKEKSFRIGE